MSTNPLEAVMYAVSYAMETGSNQQLTDAQTTTLDVYVEQKTYNYWNNVINGNGRGNMPGLAKLVEKYAAELAKDPNNPILKGDLTYYQTELQNAQTNMQTSTQQCDSATQAMQSQSGQDSTTMQQKVQLEAAVNQVLQTLSSALAQRY